MPTGTSQMCYIVILKKSIPNQQKISKIGKISQITKIIKNWQHNPKACFKKKHSFHFIQYFPCRRILWITFPAITAQITLTLHHRYFCTTGNF